MTISSLTSKVIYVGTGSTAAAAKVFAYPFTIFADADLTVSEYVVATSVATVKTLDSDYNVSGAGVSGGGNVTITGSYTNLPTGSNLIIQRVMPITQGTDYVENDAFPAETHERALDRACMINQQLQEQIDRSIKADISQTSSNILFTDFIDQKTASASSAAIAVTEAAAAVVSAAQASYSAATVTSGVTAALDNLTSPTAINQDLLPGSANYVSLGSINNEWKGLTVENTGTGDAVKIEQTGALPIGRYGLNVVSETHQTNLLAIINMYNLTATATAFQINNIGKGHSQYITQNATLGAGKHALYIEGTATYPQTSADASLVKITQDNASSTEPALEIKNDGSGAAIEISGNSGAAISVIDGDIRNVAWTDYSATSSITGWSGKTANIYYKKVGNLVFSSFYITGTSNTTTISFTLPYTATGTNITYGGAAAYAIDNGTTKTGACRVGMPTGTDTVLVFADMASGAWTNTGTKQVYGSLWFEAST